MPTFRHPAFKHITEDVPADKADEFEAAGWVKGAARKPAKKTTAKKAETPSE